MSRKLFQHKIPTPEELLPQFQNFNQPEKRTEPIVGYRVWFVLPVGGLPKLASVSFTQFVWPYRKALEKDALNDMGIHAIKRAASGSLVGLYFSYGAHIAGEVYLWGKVTEFTVGYTAQYAYPKRLFAPPEMDPTTIMQLEDEYGVPCEYRNEFEKPKQPAQSNVLTPQQVALQSFGQPSNPYTNPYWTTYTYAPTFGLQPAIGGLAQGISSGIDGVVGVAAAQLGYSAGQLAGQTAMDVFKTQKP